MTSITFDYNTSVLRSLFGLVSGVVKSVYAATGNYFKKARAEQELYAMSNQQLADIGLSRSEIHARVWGK